MAKNNFHNEKVDIFLPCRAGSERIKNKNIRPFCGTKHGLLEIKLRQLLACEFVKNIVVSTDDELIIEYLTDCNHTQVKTHRRKSELALSSTSTDQLVRHAHDIILGEHILWTHVTSPFVNQHLYDDMITSYFEKIASGYDSLMTVTKIQAFLWKNGKPLNYDREVEKWPRTQTLEAVYEVNSAAFIASRDLYKKSNDRIGEKPFLFTLDHLSAHDVDWPEDYELAIALHENNIRQI